MAPHRSGQKSGESREAQQRINQTDNMQRKTGSIPPRQADPAEGDRERVEHELKRQTEQRKEHAKPEVHADRPRDRKLKPERKGVI